MVLWQEWITCQSPMSFHMCRLLVVTYVGIDSPATTSAGWQTMSRRRRRSPVGSGSYTSLQWPLWGRLRSTGQEGSDIYIRLWLKRYGVNGLVAWWQWWDFIIGKSMMCLLHIEIMWLPYKQETFTRFKVCNFLGFSQICEIFTCKMFSPKQGQGWFWTQLQYRYLKGHWHVWIIIDML